MRYLIIGSSAAGIAAAEALRTRDPHGSVVVISDESHPAYYRPLITTLIDRGVGHDSLLRRLSTLPDEVEFRLGAKVEAIDPKNKRVSLARGGSLDYDRLLLATGSSAARPSVLGLKGPGVHVVRTIADAEGIGAEAERHRRAIIVGGGRVGMKVALALCNRGLELTVVEQEDRLVPLQFDRAAADIVSGAVQAQGIQLVFNRTVREIERENGRVKGVVLNDERRLDGDVVVLAVGITPNADLAREAGLPANEGVIVDSHMQTGDPNIFAAGDVAETADIVTGKSIIAGTWTDAVAMGRVAGINMAGGNAEYPGSLAVQNAFELAGVPTVSVGSIGPSLEKECEVYSRQSGEVYRKLVLREGCLVGALMVNDIEGAGVYTGLIKRKVRVEPFLEELIGRRPSYAPWLRTDLSVPTVAAH